MLIEKGDACRIPDENPDCGEEFGKFENVPKLKALDYGGVAGDGEQ